jgi:hypothetical protein
MSQFMLRREVNNGRSFAHVVNFIRAYDIMPYADVRSMFEAFHLKGEDVMVVIPDALDADFMNALEAVNIRYEKT